MQQEEKVWAIKRLLSFHVCTPAAERQESRLSHFGASLLTRRAVVLSWWEPERATSCLLWGREIYLCLPKNPKMTCTTSGWSCHYPGGGFWWERESATWFCSSGRHVAQRMAKQGAAHCSRSSNTCSMRANMVPPDGSYETLLRCCGSTPAHLSILGMAWDPSVLGAQQAGWAHWHYPSVPGQTRLVAVCSLCSLFASH